MQTFIIINNARDEAGNFASFYEVDQPVFKNAKFGVTEQWKLDQNYGIKPEGSFTLIS